MLTLDRTVDRTPSNLSIDTLQKLDLLTNGERRVLDTLLKTGRDNTDIAKMLGIQMVTVQNHIIKIRRKLKIKRTVNLFRVFPEFVPPPVEPTVVNVTEREKTIAELVELTNFEIGKKLNISKRTVETHLENLFSKCYVKNKREFVFKRSHFILEVGNA